MRNHGMFPVFGGCDNVIWMHPDLLVIRSDIRNTLVSLFLNGKEDPLVYDK